MSFVLLLTLLFFVLVPVSLFGVGLLFIINQTRKPLVVALVEARARELGLERVNTGTSPRQIVFGGDPLGYRMELLRGIYRTGTSTSYSTNALLIRVFFPGALDLHGYTGNNGFSGDPRATWEEVSRKTTQGMENLSAASQEALLAFQHKHGGIWLHGESLPTDSETSRNRGPRLEHTVREVPEIAEPVRVLVEDLAALARVIQTEHGSAPALTENTAPAATPDTSS